MNAGRNSVPLRRRSLVYHWRTHVATLLGVAAAGAVLIGALLVGDSMRGSLRANALDRLGRVALAVQSPRYFRAALADDLVRALDLLTDAPPNQPARLVSVIIAPGSASNPQTRATAGGVQVLGIDPPFWTLAPGLAAQAGRDSTQPPDGGVLINETLARELGLGPGEDIVLRVPRPEAVSPDLLLGRRDAPLATLRLTVEAVLPTRDLGAFSLAPQQRAPLNAYVPLSTLQRALEQRERVNTLLIAEPEAEAPGGEAVARAWRDAWPARVHVALQHSVTLADLGLRLRSSAADAALVLESDGFLLPLAAENSAQEAAGALGWTATGTLAYLANTIELLRNDTSVTHPDQPPPAAPATETSSSAPTTEIPYSTVVALDTATAAGAALKLATGEPAPPLQPGEVLLNTWAAADLGAQPGDQVRMTYYVAAPFGRLETRSATFRLRGIVAMSAAATDPALVPEYPGVTDAETLADWEPPFPLDLKRIRPKDEDYWRVYRAAPKAFVSLDDGVRLWAAESAHFGQLTALRLYPPADRKLEGASTRNSKLETRNSAADVFTTELRQHLDPAALGLHLQDVRARALEASHGATDFAGLFVGFSQFLIVAALLLVALLFRLGVERRAGEIGLLLAVGFTPRRVARLLLSEGLALALIGAALGLVLGRAYAWLMLAGLKSWWSTATGPAPFLRLHAEPASYVLGFAATLLIAGAALAWSLRGLTRLPPRRLLAGVSATSEIEQPQVGVPCQAPAATAGARRRAERHPGLLVAAALAALATAVIALSLLGARISPPAGFFAGGTLLLLSALLTVRHWLHAAPPADPVASARALTGRTALLRLGVRNARRRPGRSLLTASLIAAATFVITSLQAMRLEPPADIHDRHSGAGGFTLLAEATAPLLHDLNTPAGRSALNLSAEAEAILAGTTIMPFRLRAGDEASCLSLYRPTEPRILGAPPAMLQRGGFTFSGVPSVGEDVAAPWRLLGAQLPDGAIPAIADEAAATWQLHKRLGDEVRVTGESGQPVRLRLVALLKGSILQGALIVSESNFTRFWPSLAGYAFFLIETPSPSARPVADALRRELADHGLAVTPAARRLAELQAVQNTYLSTFQMLGGLGLLLGTAGLAAVLLRNVWERRAELALLRTLGFTRRALGVLVLVENALLVAAGLLAGLIPAAIVAAPHAAVRTGSFPWLSLVGLFALIFAVGLLAGAAALIPALRAPLLPALRSE
ncbi:MAG: ABC transporter permease [Planctomycetota bacterium]